MSIGYFAFAQCEREWASLFSHFMFMNEEEEEEEEEEGVTIERKTIRRVTQRGAVIRRLNVSNSMINLFSIMLKGIADARYSQVPGQAEMHNEVWAMDNDMEQYRRRLHHMTLLDPVTPRQTSVIGRLSNRLLLLYGLLTALIVIVLVLLALVLLLYFGRNLLSSQSQSSIPTIPTVNTKNVSTSSDDLPNHYQAKNQLWLNEACQEKTCTKHFDVPPLLVLSLDGFWSGYFDRELTPAIARVADCGAKASFMYPAYPSKTFPNHFTIASGLYPESHGIVDNAIYDATLDPPLYTKNTTNERWYKGEPIWSTVRKNRQHSAIFFWPGSETKLQGLPATYPISYNSSVSFSTQIDQIIEWLKLGEDKRPSFIAVYLDRPDADMHLYGPDSDQVNSALIYVDAMVNYLFSQLHKSELMDCVNVVLLSDHGGQKLDPEKKVILDDFVAGMDGVRVFDGVIGRISVENSSSTVDDILNKMRCKKGDQFRVYDKMTIPKRLHYASSSRIGDIVVDSVIGGETFINKDKANGFVGLGDHGYDNREQSMRAFFAARGPSIVPEARIEPFENIELYNLFVDLLQLPFTAENNGTRGVLYPIMRNPPEIRETEMLDKLDKCSTELQFDFCGFDCPISMANQLNGTVKCHLHDDILLTASLLTASEHHRPLSNYCSQQLCNSTMIYDRRMRQVIVVQSTLSSYSDKNGITNCTVYLDHIDQDNCSTGQIKKNDSISMFSPFDYNRLINVGRFSISHGFATGIWLKFVELLDRYRRHYKQLLLFSGPIYDWDANGLVDSYESMMEEGTLNNFSSPTHFFFILTRCEGGWTEDGRSCNDSTKAQVLTFILPNVPDDLNCLHPEEYIFRHTARVRDVELLTGLELFTDRHRWPVEKAISLRTHLPSRLWNLDRAMTITNNNVQSIRHVH